MGAFGVCLLLVFVLLRPHEFLPALKSLSPLNLATLVTMAGLAIGLVKDRAALVALVVGCGSAVLAARLVDSSAAIMIGGLLGPLAGLALYRRRPAGATS